MTPQHGLLAEAEGLQSATALEVSREEMSSPAAV